MPKRRFRRTDPDRHDTGLGDMFATQMRDMSTGAVEAATEATRTALEGMRDVGRMAADMVVPATRRSVRVAGSASREVMNAANDAARTGTRQVSRAADRGADATRTATKSARRVAKPVTGTRKRTTKRAKTTTKARRTTKRRAA